jgi:hypothetical protein
MLLLSCVSLQDINALEQHIKNLLSPATPYIFNTLYDPYRCVCGRGGGAALSNSGGCCRVITWRSCCLLLVQLQLSPVTAAALFIAVAKANSPHHLHVLLYSILQAAR